MLGREVGNGGRGFGVDREEQASGQESQCVRASVCESGTIHHQQTVVHFASLN